MFRSTRSSTGLEGLLVDQRVLFALQTAEELEEKDQDDDANAGDGE